MGTNDIIGIDGTTNAATADFQYVFNANAPLTGGGGGGGIDPGGVTVYRLRWHK